MKRAIAIILVLSLMTWVPLRAGEPLLLPAPFYSLPADGGWIEFEWVHFFPDGKKAEGTLRLSSVGKLKIDGAEHRWVEIKRATRQGKILSQHYRKLLISEKTLAAGPFRAAVVRCLDREGERGAVTELRPERLKDFLAMGLRSGAALRQVGQRDKLDTPLGSFNTRKMTTEQPPETGRDYRAWLTDKAPFGCVQFEIVEKGGEAERRVTFRAVAVRIGNNAVSDVNEGKAP